jgi:hypothetical protein
VWERGAVRGKEWGRENQKEIERNGERKRWILRGRHSIREREREREEDMGQKEREAAAKRGRELKAD